MEIPNLLLSLHQQNKQMKQIERQLRALDGYDRMQYKHHLKGLIKQSSVKSDIKRHENVISLIDKINQE